MRRTPLAKGEWLVSALMVRERHFGPPKFRRRVVGYEGKNLVDICESKFSVNPTRRDRTGSAVESDDALGKHNVRTEGRQSCAFRRSFGLRLASPACVDGLVLCRREDDRGS